MIRVGIRGAVKHETHRRKATQTTYLRPRILGTWFSVWSLGMLTFEQANERLAYDPETGGFTWKIRSRKTKVGSIAGSVKISDSGKKYRLIGLFGRHYKSHRLAWLLMTGSFPDQQLDHIDGDGCNNKWSNLRAVTPQENQRNMRLMRHNTSGVCGVSWSKSSNKWFAHIKIGRKTKSLGYFTDKADAVAARKSAESILGFHANHGTQRSL